MQKNKYVVTALSEKFKHHHTCLNMNNRKHFVEALSTIFVLICTLFLVSENALAAPLLQSSNLVYKGSFQVPAGSTCSGGSQDISYVKGGMGFNPVSGTSIFVSGHDYDPGCIAEVSIPTNCRDGNQSCSGSASFAQPLRNAGLTGSIGGEGATTMGGLYVYNNKLYASMFKFYSTTNPSQSASHWRHPLNLSSPKDAGPVDLGGANDPAFRSNYMGDISSPWQTALGGPSLTGNCCLSIISRTSSGPSAYSWNPDSMGSQSAIPLVYYDLSHQTLGGLCSNCVQPIFNGATAIRGIAQLVGTDTVLFYGNTGTGTMCYKGDVSGCSDNGGYNSTSHAFYIWLYNANDLAAVKAGTKQPWEPIPYAHFALSAMGSASNYAATGLAYNPATQMLYMGEQCGYGFCNEVIHAYHIEGLVSTPDTTPPTLPANFNLAATSPSQSSISVSWNPATDNIGVTGYQVERCQGSGCSNFTQVGTPTASPFVDSGLTPNTFYNYHVRARDAAGNLSGWSNVVGATTQAPDTTPPTAPASLSTSIVSSSNITLAWTASTDNVAVTGYKVERCAGASCTNFTQIGTPTATSYSDTGLSASTLYRYQVRATDAAGNNSSYSNIAEGTTPVAPPTPTFISEYETAWNSATSPKTTANFNVQTGDILVAYAVNEDTGNTIATPPTGTLTGTWTLKQTISTASYTSVRLWTLSVTTNQSNVNVSFSNSSGNFGGNVLHFRNGSTVGVTQQATGATGNPTLTLTGVSENSSIVMVNGDWSARTGNRTYNTTSAGAFTETSAYADGTSYGVEAGYYPNAGTAGNKTIGLTAPTGMKWALAAIEVKGSGVGGGDTAPPTSPTNMAATAPSSSSISVSWTASTDNVGVAGYIVERCQGSGCSNFTQVGTPTASPFVDSGLTPNTFYNYHVRATDAAGNLSGWSNVVGATTQSGGGGGTACSTVNVNSVSQLVNAVNTANDNPSCSTTILIADGTYTLTAMLPITASNMTIKSQSGNRDAVILQGDAMTSSASVKIIFRVDANNFTAENMTLQRVGWHLIQVVGENNRDNFTAKNLVFRNAWEQMLKVTYVDTSSVGSDNGLVENSLFEFTSGQAGQYYTGGIDAHNAKNWVVRGNTFKNIISPSGSVAEHAIHFWSNSEDTLVERNLIINCDRGIGFGLVQGKGHLRGIIRNNMIYHAAGNGSFADVSIEADESPNTQIYNNTIFMQNSYPNAIEYRFPLSSGLIIRNNLTNKVIQARDGATATLSNNITNAQASWFVNPSQGDLHLANGTTSANNAGTSISGLTNDYDGDARPQGGGIDVGADEYMAGGGSQSCNTVTANNFSQAAYNSYGAPYDAFQTSTNLMNTQCTGADTHTINLTTGVTGDTTRIVYTKGYWYDAVTTAWRQYAGTCTGALNGEWCQGSVSATITDPNVSTASAANPTYLVGMTCSVQGGSWKCGCRDTSCTNFSWQIQGAGLP